MTFDKILDDGRLWAVRYDNEPDNCFDSLFAKWYDMSWLRAFFQENITDLSAYFKITDVYQAVMETLQEAKVLQCLMLDISPQANLDELFRHLENSRYSEMSLGKEKAKGNGLGYRPSWLRIYAIKMDKGAYLITGGAIKLTATMSERPHTLAELAQLEQVRNKLIELGATPQEARSVLPNSLKTEIVMTMNLREWRHSFTLRTSKAAHPQMREVAIPLLKEFQKLIPVVFDDLIN